MQSATGAYEPVATAVSTGDRVAPKATWQVLYRQLQRRRDEIIHEIRTYPPPIPACDVQFNYLLEQRTNVLREIKALERIDVEDSSALQGFVSASAFCSTD